MLLGWDIHRAIIWEGSSGRDPDWIPLVGATLIGIYLGEVGGR